ncbi:MAG: hypothetical protein G01um101419_46 [Parcubacteria group bacterium Gr01-1014_19]|nr:MAG: hypothetical protein G01um101419_46 [Parcubacteria group bacterium Gr01-1014_19]
MNSEKVADLRTRFPFIGAECRFNFGDGWFAIVAGFCGAAKFRMDETFRITQLECRDGKLNIMYVGHGGSAMDKLVAWAEIRSVHTCEHCGHEFKSGYGSGTRICSVRGRKVRMCPGCLERYETLLSLGREMALNL